ncbi:MAG: hypothetical protein FWE84_06490 [Firmicutes bacterium]|nr:hypothetical protein [Bacillota bacterium]
MFEKIPNSTTNQLSAYLPWSDSIPPYCRIPKPPSPTK